MMPKRIAETSANEQISEYVGSGPFKFEKDLWKPGNIAVYTKFEQYKPRSEAPSWASGGKVAQVDRVEWISMPAHQTAANAPVAGDNDSLEAPPHDLLPILTESEDLRLHNHNPPGTIRTPTCRKSRRTTPE